MMAKSSGMIDCMSIKESFHRFILRFEQPFDGKPLLILGTIERKGAGA
jgi:hypothetical protein